MLPPPEKIVIQKSLDHLPPPYCYRYSIEIDYANDCEVSFRIEYFDREEISPEEIEAEGFSEDDNVEWTGQLPSIWSELLAGLPDLLTNTTKENDLGITFYQEGKPLKKQPKDPSKINYLIQELIQAIYEKTERQEPLAILFKDISKGSTNSYRLQISFYQRKATIDEKEIPWDIAQQTIERLFSFDFDEFNALEKEPSEKGFYVNSGDGYWHKADRSIKSYDGKPVADQMRNLVEMLLQQ